MALFGNVSEDFTRTGKGFFQRASNFFSYFPIVGGILAFPLGMIGTAIESAKWLFQGKIASAVTTLAAGTAGNLVNSIPGVSWWINDITGLTTGATAGEYARAATETVVGGGFKLIGQNPTVTSSYPAAIGSINGGMDYVGGKDNFRDKIAGERGMTRAQMDARADQAYVNNTQGANALGA